MYASNVEKIHNYTSHVNNFAWATIKTALPLFSYIRVENTAAKTGFEHWKSNNSHHSFCIETLKNITMLQ